MYRVNDEFFEVAGPTYSTTSLGGAAGVSGAGAVAKRAFDVAIACAFLVVFLPLLLILAIGVRISSRGPIFFVQERIGRHGRTFRFYKFRSMVQNSDQVFAAFLDSDHDARQQWQTYQKLNNDPRITRFGRFIRKTSLDELPQFWNVLRGDMSVVGPRPCMPSQKSLYGQCWASYCAVRPGLTGLWQVSGRNWLTFEQRAALDAEYVRTWSCRRDIAILVKTVRVVLTGHGSS